MSKRRRPAASAGLLVVVLVTAGCASSETIASTVAPPASTTVTTTSLPSTTATTEPGPQPLGSTRFMEPGQYVTTVFEPKVVFAIESTRRLEPIDERFVAGFFGGNFQNRHDPHRVIAVHGWWREDSPDEVIAEFEAHESIGFGPDTETTVGGLAGTQIDITVPALVGLWQDPLSIEVQGFLGSRAAGRLIILETQVGTIVIIAEATEEEWDEFLPVAEEILAGISFPDL